MAEDAFGPICLRMYTPKRLDAIKGVPVSFDIKNFLSGTSMALGMWEIEWGDGAVEFSQNVEYLAVGQSRTLKHSYTQAGSYTIRFEWMGGFQANGVWYRPDGQRGTCNNENVVIPVNVREPALPIANAGPPRPLVVDLLGGGLTEDLVLDGSGSYHPDGLPITSQWAVMGGPCAGNLPWQLAQFNSPKAVALRAGTTISKPCFGTYGFRLDVRDSNGSIGTAFVYHTFAELNHAPEANAGAPRVWQLGSGYRLREDFVLDGTRSRDPDGDPLSYGWAVQSGPGMTKLPWETNTFTQASAIALRARTVVPPD